MTPALTMPALGLPALGLPSVETLAALALGLVLVTVGLTAATVWLHVRQLRAERLRAARWARWEPQLLGLLVDAPAWTDAGHGVGDAPAETPAARAFTADVGPGERDDALALLAAFALRLDGRDLARLGAAAEPLLGRCRARLADRRASRRAAAVRLLGLLGPAADRPRIAAALEDPSPDVAMAAARALARTHDPLYVRPLLRALDRFAAWGTPAVASMLARYGLPAGPALADALADESRPLATRLAACEALRRLGYYPAGAVASELLTTAADHPRDLVAGLLRLVRDVGGPALAEAVRPLLGSPDDVLRMHAVSALAALSPQPDDAARIEFALGDTSAWVGLRAARGLVEAGRAASLARLAAGDDLRADRARTALAQAGLPLPERSTSPSEEHVPELKPPPVRAEDGAGGCPRSGLGGSATFETAQPPPTPPSAAVGGGAGPPPRGEESLSLRRPVSEWVESSDLEPTGEPAPAARAGVRA